MELQGFCTINRNATTCKGTNNPEWFVGKDCIVIEFARDGGALVMDWEGRALASFDKEDVYRKFECRLVGGVVCPPEMDVLQQMVYVNKVTTRKGGYNSLLKNMVIQAGLMRGKFTDDFLFQKEREDNLKTTKP